MDNRLMGPTLEIAQGQLSGHFGDLAHLRVDLFNFHFQISINSKDTRRGLQILLFWLRLAVIEYRIDLRR